MLTIFTSFAVIAFLCGVYVERIRWNGLIRTKRLPNPTQAWRYL